MATLVEHFCSEGEVAETGEFLLSGAAESMKISSQHSPIPRGRKSTRIQAVRMKQKGRVSRGMCSCLELNLEMMFTILHTSRIKPLKTFGLRAVGS